MLSATSILQHSNMSGVHSGNTLNLRRDVRNAVAFTSATKSTRRPPHKTTDAQKQILMAEFEDDPNPSAMKRDRLAKLLNIERRIVKNWFSNQRALRRKTGQGYRGWMSGSVSSHSACGSGDEFEMEPAPPSENPAKPSSKRTAFPPRNDAPASPVISAEPRSPPPLQNILSVTVNHAEPHRTLLPKSAAPQAPSQYTRDVWPPSPPPPPPPPQHSPPPLSTSISTSLALALSSTTHVKTPSSTSNLMPLSPPVSLPIASPSSWFPPSSPVLSPARLLHRQHQRTSSHSRNNNPYNWPSGDIPDGLRAQDGGTDAFSPSLLRGYPESALRSSLAV